MEELIYMVHRYRENYELEYPMLLHGAFKSYRGASEWLIEQGYTPY